MQVVQDCEELFGPEQGEEEEGQGLGARPGLQDDDHDKGIATTKTGDKAAVSRPRDEGAGGRDGARNLLTR